MGQLNDQWPEITRCINENGNELVFGGPVINQRSSFDLRLFSLPLTSLEISNTLLMKVPNSLAHLIQLTTLILRNNRLVVVPEGLHLLVHLKWFDIGFNKLVDFPKACLKAWLNLEVLILSNNMFSSLDSLDKLQNLRQVDLSSNDFIELPAGITSLPKLESLGASFNGLQSLPSDFSNVASLKCLDFYMNCLHELPHNLGRCAALRRLDVRANNIVDLRVQQLCLLVDPTHLLNYLRKLDAKSKDVGYIDDDVDNEKPVLHIIDIFNRNENQDNLLAC